MKLKLFIARILAFISSLWNKVDKIIDTIAPVSINVVEQIKKINESTTGDIIEILLSNIIPGKGDDLVIIAIRAKLRQILPQILLQMNIVRSVAEIPDINDQMKAIITHINMSPNETKNAYYHIFCTKILEALSDGKLSWSESVQIAEFYYSNIYKK